MTTTLHRCCQCRREHRSRQQADRFPTAKGHDFCGENREPNTGKPTKSDRSGIYRLRTPTSVDAEEVFAIRSEIVVPRDRFGYTQALLWKAAGVPADWNT